MIKSFKIQAKLPSFGINWNPKYPNILIRKALAVILQN